MLIAILGNRFGFIRRDIEFSRGVFAADGLGEVTIRELREFEAAGQLEWVCPDIREFLLSCSPRSRVSAGGDPSVADKQLRLAVETEVVRVPPHRIGSKTEAELKWIVADMAERGWLLVEDTRMGAAGGQLAFQRAEPLDPAVIAAHSFAR